MHAVAAAVRLKIGDIITKVNLTTRGTLHYLFAVSSQSLTIATLCCVQVNNVELSVLRKSTESATTLIANAGATMELSLKRKVKQ
jgi:hypothetical protein